MLKLHQQAPEFSGLDHRQEPLKLASFRGKKMLVLYFYPKDDTPGCTLEAQQFTELANAFAQLDTVVIGVSRDDCNSHLNFIEKYKLNVVLLADITGELCQSYGVWQEKEKNGVKKMGVVRSTFIIDKEGMLVDVMYGVSPDGHAQEILNRVQQLSSQ